MTEYDIVIIGGGLVGTSLVLALQQQGWRIGVLEKNLPQSIANPGNDDRPISLSYTSKVILDTLNVWRELENRACPIKEVHVSNQGGFGRCRINAIEHKLSALGYVVPFASLQMALYQKAAAQNKVDILPSSEILSIEKEDDEKINIEFVGNNKKKLIQASLLIVADGTSSTSRKLLNIKTQQFDAGETALTGSLELADPHQCIAYERFTPQGTKALLPMMDQKKYRFVWTMSHNYSEKVEEFSNQQLLNALQQAFGSRAGQFKKIIRDRSFPLKTVMATQQIQPSIVLIGNAAHTLYPIAAQGFNLGLRDVAALADILVTGKTQEKILGNWNQLQQYEAWRQKDQKTVADFTRHVISLFDLQLPLMSKVRGLGLLAFDLFPGAKQRFMNRLLGRMDKMPRLARGVPLWE